MLSASSRAWDREEGKQTHQQEPWKSGPFGEVTFTFSDPLPDKSDNNGHPQYHLINATLFNSFTLYT